MEPSRKAIKETPSISGLPNKNPRLITAAGLLISWLIENSKPEKGIDSQLEPEYSESDQPTNTMNK